METTTVTVTGEQLSGLLSTLRSITRERQGAVTALTITVGDEHHVQLIATDTSGARRSTRHYGNG